MITTLGRVVESPPDRPMVGGPTHPMRITTRRAAFEPDYWNEDVAASVAKFFDDMAPVWDERSGVGEMAPLQDALARGGAFGPRCLEIGAGTGAGTKALADQFEQVIALDIAGEMLKHFHDVKADLVLADGARLPFAPASMDAVVLVNAFLFPAELDRVLAPKGAMVWMNSLAEYTPIHLPVSDVVAALPGAWSAITAEAGWGMWAVLRRA
jgi:ubiquinone/menaquinone biosynthesis C-methylase UbiE